MLLNFAHLMKYVLFFNRLVSCARVRVCLLISLHAFVYLAYMCVFMYVYLQCMCGLGQDRNVDVLERVCLNVCRCWGGGAGVGQCNV